MGWSRIAIGTSGRDRHNSENSANFTRERHGPAASTPTPSSSSTVSGSDARAGRTIPVVNPASGDTIGTLAFAERADLDEALESTAKASNSWRKVSAFDPLQADEQAATLLRDRIDLVSRLMTMEQGKTLGEAKPRS